MGVIIAVAQAITADAADAMFATHTDTMRDVKAFTRYKVVAAVTAIVTAVKPFVTADI